MRGWRLPKSLYKQILVDDVIMVTSRSCFRKFCHFCNDVKGGSNFELKLIF